jgi:hypothetical protein
MFGQGSYQKGFATTILHRDYQGVNATHTFEEVVKSPDVLVGHGSFGSLRIWAEKKRIDWRGMLCQVEQGDKGQGTLIDALRSEAF